MNINVDFAEAAGGKGFPRSLGTFLLNPCFHAVALFRLSALLYRCHLEPLAKIVWCLNRMLYHVDLDYKAKLAPGFRLVHGRVVAAGAGSGAGVRAYGVYLQDAGLGDGAAGCRLSVDASWLDAAGADGGVACLGGSLVSARFVTPAGGVFGAGGVVDASGAVAPHVVIEPDVATPPAGETDGREVPGCGAGEPSADTSPAAGEPTTVPTANPSLKPAAETTKTTTTATKTTVSTSSRPKTATATTAALPKTADSNWIAASLTLFILGTVLLAAVYRC